MFLYYVRDARNEYHARMTDSWPPIGNEINDVVFRIGIPKEDADLPLAKLAEKYPLSVVGKE